MPRLSNEVIGDAYTSTFARETLEELVDVGSRMAGHVGEKEGARVIGEAFEAAGLRDIRTTEFEIPGWWRGSSSVSLPDHGTTYDADHHVIAFPGSPSGTVEAELVDGGYGAPEQLDGTVDGKIGLFRNGTPPDYDQWYQDGGKYENAVDAGAAGYVVRNDREGCLPRVSAVGRSDRPAGIPAVGVSKELGEKLLRYAEDDTSVRIQVDCRRERATSVNTHGVVGPSTDEEVLVAAHVDAHDLGDGAADNGIGSAMLPEIGRLLVQSEDDLDAKVRLVAFGAEEIGLQGSSHWAESHDLDRVKCVVNIDGAWGSGNAVVNRAIFESAEGPFERAADRLHVPVKTLREGPLADALPFARQGVPATLVGADSGESGRGWSHTHADTLEKIEPADVRALTVFVAQAVLELASEDAALERKEAGALTGSGDGAE